MTSGYLELPTRTEAEAREQLAAKLEADADLTERCLNTGYYKPSEWNDARKRIGDLRARAIRLRTGATNAE